MSNRPFTITALCVISAALLFPASAADTIELGAPFADNAILQREVALPVWGWSKPGTAITVDFAGQKESGTAGADGKWMIKLKPLKASSEAAEMVISDSESGKVVVKNVLVGEVWHASGQSNMEWFAAKSHCAALAQEMTKAQEEIPIREFRTDTVSALYPQRKVASEAGWKTSRKAGDFSALALAFANELHRELKVPVGILLTSHSNTRIEAFTERKAIEAHQALKVDQDMIHDGDAATEQGRAAFEKYYADLEAWQKASGALGFPLEKPLKRPELPGIAGQWRGPSQFFNGKIAPVVPYAIRGSLWCQGESNAGDGRLYAARMEALVRGWREAWGLPQMPFYFTQMQAYGSANPDEVGMADVRQAQHLFFMNNRSHVGMVVQTDLNPAAPGNIHYQNKLHPGMRLARWALAKDYGRDIAFTGPIFEKYTIEGNKAVVVFEKESLSGGLMEGSKGQEKDMKEPDKFVEPARPTPGEKLNHFRLCGKDRKWHAAEAVIVNDTVVVTSKDVPEPIGVQYAHSAAPMNANLYNKAGLPATPFAAVEGKLIFDEDDSAKAAAEKAKYAQFTDPDYPVFTVAAHYRDGAIIQRDQPIPVWGFANKGVEVTVTLGNESKSAVANDQQQWAVSFPALKASSQPITLTAKASHGHNKTVKNILVGDVWFLTGSTQLTSEPAFDKRDPKATAPGPMRSSASSVGGLLRARMQCHGSGDWRWVGTGNINRSGRRQSSLTQATASPCLPINSPKRSTVPTSRKASSPCLPAAETRWHRHCHGLHSVESKTPPTPHFSPGSMPCSCRIPTPLYPKKAISEHVQAVKAQVAKIAELAKNKADLASTPPQFPAFPEPGRDGAVKPDTVPTFAYNWCVSPLTPMGVAGVIWVPSKENLGYTPADYAAELDIYARSLPATYGQEKVPFLFAHPSSALVPGITAPKLDNAASAEFDQWPKSLRELAHPARHRSWKITMQEAANMNTESILSDRRRFLKTGIASAFASPLLAQTQPVVPGVFNEPARNLPINNDADVIVCGAGPAGVTAAISAARAGAKVRLFEAHGSLGGVWTSSLLGYLLDFDKPGFNQELVKRLRERDAINGGGMNGLSYQPEEMKLLLEELCTTAGVKVQLHTRVAAAYREGRTLSTIVTESKSGRQAWKAPVFIDATGDGRSRGAGRMRIRNWPGEGLSLSAHDNVCAVSGEGCHADR